MEKEWEAKVIGTCRTNRGYLYCSYFLKRGLLLLLVDLPVGYFPFNTADSAERILSARGFHKRGSKRVGT